MSPVAADWDSADSAPVKPDLVGFIDCDAVVVRVIEASAEAPLVEVGDDLSDEAPHPAISAALASAQAPANLWIESMLVRLLERA
jgi:hypothetical protein